ncbi:MAG: hypothetical protein HKP58_02175 [Desulfatitalea sp.]|nr:hypothetical protein [Desulfatitalea sp.]NNJ99196.1 hypothetical protein [Desulfatitalea sp.]
MTIAENLPTMLAQNQHELYITDADDLLAAWRHRREKTRQCRCFDFSRVPQEYRLSAPPDEKAPLMPCHVTIRRKLSQVHQTPSGRPPSTQPSTVTVTEGKRP